MTNEERDIITSYIERVSGAVQGAGSVPGSAPALAPIDPEADGLIGQLLAKYPEARYRLAQTAFVQEHALAAAQNRIKQLEYELQHAQQAAQQSQAQARPGGFLSGLFGGGAARPAPGAQGPVWNQGQPQQAAPPPPPQYAAGYQPGMFQRQGSGFLGSALSTAAGVAGGVVVGNALMDLFSPHRGLGADLGGGGGGFGAAASPWGEPAPATDPGYVDQGSWTTPDTGSDQASWDPGGGGDQGAWNDPGSGDQDSWDSSGGDGGGWDDNS